MARPGKRRVHAELPPEHARWRIERLVPGGDGMARLPDGRVGFAAGAFPGEVLAVSKVELHAGFVRALTFDVVQPSVDRVTPPCPVAARCGGCAWMNLERSAQVQQKGEVLRDALTRIGSLRTLPAALAVHTAGAGLRYRSRVRFQIDDAGRIGFFARGTHELVEVPGCLIAQKEIDEALELVRSVAAGHAGALAAFEGAEIRVAPDGPSPLVVFFERPGAPKGGAPRVVGKLLRQLESLIAVEVTTAHARKFEPRHADQRWELGDGTTLHVPPGAFLQVNWPVNARLVESVVAGAKARGLGTFYDFYCGVGNFSLPLARAGLSGVGIELEQGSVAAAERARDAQGLSGVQFVAASAEDWVREVALTLPRPDFVLVDAPRAGAHALVLALVELAPPIIAVCSCDPATLARDLRALVQRGYEVDEIQAFDMFPQTHHLEAIVWLRRAEPA